MQLMSELLDVDGVGFAKRIGKQSANVNAYCSGRKIPGKAVLRSSLQHAFEWDLITLFELVPLKISSLSSSPGIYALYDSSGSILYVGQATNLKAEVNQTLHRNVNFAIRSGPKLSKKKHPKYKDVVHFMSAYEVSSSRVRHNLEALLLRVFPNQSHNNKMGNFK